MSANGSLHRCTRAKPFDIYPVNDAGKFVTGDEPEWLRLWEGPLTEEEGIIYRKFVPEGVEYFDRAKKIFNAELRIPLTKFLDTEDAKISFSQEWDMVVAEHVRAVIASERPRRGNEVGHEVTEDSFGNDSDDNLPRPFLDSSGDFTYTSEEEEAKEEEWPRVHPVAPVYELYVSNGPMIKVPNLASTRQSKMAPSNQPRYSADRERRNNAPRQLHHSAPQQRPSPTGELREAGAGAPVEKDPLLYSTQQRPSQPNFQFILFYYHGRTPAFFKTLPGANEPSHVSGVNRLMVDSSSPAELIFEETCHFSFMMGQFVPFISYLMRNLTEKEVKEVFRLLPLVPDMKALVDLYESKVLGNTTVVDRKLLAHILATNLSKQSTILLRQGPAQAGATAGVSCSVVANREEPIARNFGLVGSSAWASIANVSGSSSSGFGDLSFDIPADILPRKPRHISSDPKDYTFEDSVHCRTELDMAIRKETLAAAISLASSKSKVDMVHKLEETSSIELAKRFLKTPEAAFVLHGVYGKPGEPLGNRSVPRNKVLPESFVSDNFITLEALGESVEGGDLDNFFVEYWKEALEWTENHFRAHDETMRALQDVYLNEEADSKLIHGHLNCLRECVPHFRYQLSRHKETMEMVSCVLTIKEYNIGKLLLGALEKMSAYKPPEAIRAYYIRPTHAEHYTFDLDQDEEFFV